MGGSIFCPIGLFVPVASLNTGYGRLLIRAGVDVWTWIADAHDIFGAQNSAG
jgi:hypothetical protein